MYKQARKKTGLSIEEAAFQLHIAPRTLCKYESDDPRDPRPRPETVLSMGLAYKTPVLTMLYCRHECAIGRRYCFDVLNNIDVSPVAILTKYRHEKREFNEMLERMTEILLNKRGKDDCTEEEIGFLKKAFLEALDVEHVIETLKIRLYDFLDVAELINEHNQKCIDCGYYDPKQPALQIA